MSEAFDPLHSYGGLPLVLLFGPLFGASLACLYFSFRPGNTPAPKFRRWVISPVVLVVVLVLARVAWVASTPESTLEGVADRFRRALEWFPQMAAYFGPGFCAAMLALVLVGVGLGRVRLGQTTLPVCFRLVSEAPHPALPNPSIQRDILRFFLFVLLVPVLIAWLAVPFAILFDSGPRQLKPDEFVWWHWLPVLLGSLVPTAGAIWLLKGNRKEALARMLRPGAASGWKWALALPVGIAALPRLLIYLGREIQWYFPALRTVQPPAISDLSRRCRRGAPSSCSLRCWRKLAGAGTCNRGRFSFLACAGDCFLSHSSGQRSTCRWTSTAVSHFICR